MTHAETKIHRGHENVRHHHDVHHPSHRRRKVTAKPGDGFDVSENNGSVNWEKADQKEPFVAIAKTTEGATYTDKLWTAGRAREMEATHARCAIYHFARPDNNTPQAEVANVLRAVEKAKIELVGSHWWDGTAKVDGWRLFLDWETEPYNESWLHGFGDEFHRHTNHLSDLYCFGSSINGCLGALDAFHYIDFAAYVPDWTKYFTGPKNRVALWQHTASGSWPGIIGALDLDKFILKRS